MGLKWDWGIRTGSCELNRLRPESLQSLFMTANQSYNLVQATISFLQLRGGKAYLLGRFSHVAT